jgi:hypothetical protein
MIYLVIAIYLIVGFIGGRHLFKKKWWREFATYLTLLTFGFFLLALQSVGIQFPSPGEGIRLLVEKVWHLGYH